MASIRKEILVEAQPEHAWDTIRDIGALHTRLVPGFVVDTRLDGDSRIVTFGNGMVAKERIINIDDHARRLVWAVVESPQLTHHNASIQVFDEGGRSRLVWIADLLPHELAGQIEGMIEQGMKAMKRALERAR